MPDSWNQLWEMLPNRAQIDGRWQPPLPLILSGWHDTPALSKMSRLAEHIEWAGQHGALEPIVRFLRELPEDDWFHFGD